MKIDKEQLENWFSYHAPYEFQFEKYGKIREAGLLFAEVILDNTPTSADQTVAIRKVREAVMVANSAIACSTEC